MHTLKGNWETKRVWLDGKELLPARSQKVYNHSPDGAIKTRKEMGKNVVHERCSKCGIFLSKIKKHKCKNVDMRGCRYCKICRTLLKNKGWERYSSICGKCGKKKLRENERIKRSELIKIMGGKCTICNYNRCEACLEFHHKNKIDKDESSKGTLLKKIEKHPEKFELLCNRCHRELEMGIIKEGDAGHGL
jgi:hypothetical protein